MTTAQRREAHAERERGKKTRKLFLISNMFVVVFLFVGFDVGLGPRRVCMRVCIP